MENLIDLLRNKNLGKYLIITIVIALGIYANYFAYNQLFASDASYYAPGTVIAKNDYFTTGRHTKQRFIISFKFDDDNLGTQDITTTFSDWNRLNPGDRTSFKVNKSQEKNYDRTTDFIGATFVIIAGIFDIIMAVIILWVLITLGFYIWDF